MIGGREVRAGGEFDDRSPIDTRILLGTFQSASREQVREAIAAARAAYPGVERAAVAGARRAAEEGRRRHPRTPLGAVGADGIRGRQEPARMRRRRRGIGRSDRVLLRSDRGARRLRDEARHARSRRRELERAAAVRRLGRDLAVQFSARARRRSGRRRAGRRQHGRLQAGIGHAAARLQAVRSDGRGRACRPASSTSSPAAAAPPGQELIDNPDIDGIVFTGSKDVGHAPDSRQRGARRAAAADHRDGRQESGDRHAVGRSRQGDRRRHAVGVRRAGTEVLGLLARLRRQGRFATSSSGCSSRRRRRSDRQSAQARRLPRARSSTKRRSRPTNAPSRRPRPTAARSSPAAGASPTASSRTATSSSRRSSTACRSTIRCFPKSCSCRSRSSPTSSTLDEAIDLANSTEYGLTAGIFSEDEREIARVLRPDPGGRHLRQPARRRDDRRVAGHQFVRRLEGQRLDRPRHRRPVLRAAVHARAEPGAGIRVGMSQK